MGFIETVQSIDFTAVGATNVLPLDIKDAVIKEKLSVMLYAKYFSKETAKPVLKYSEFKHPYRTVRVGDDPDDRQVFFTAQKGGSHYEFFVSNLSPYINYCLVKTEEPNNEFRYYSPSTSTSALSSEPYCISIKPGAKLEEISIYDSMRTFNDYADSTRIDELSRITCPTSVWHTYAPFRLDSTFLPQQFPDTLPTTPNADEDDFISFQNELKKWYKAAFPRFYKRFVLKEKKEESSTFGDQPNPGSELKEIKDDSDHIPVNLPSPIFYDKIGPMAYVISDDNNTLSETRFYRLFLNNGCGLREALIPACFIQGKGWERAIMTGLPNRDHLPLWNLQRIMSPDTKTVVLCSCIQDAEALHRDNEDIDDVAFTSFVDVGENLELIDFSPLVGKNVVFLISNHNGKSLADEYERIGKVFEFIKESNIKINDCVFVQREVQYPDSTLTIATPGELASIYYHTPPTITPSSLIPPMDETEFFSMIAKIRKERETPPFWAPIEQEPVKDNPAHDILIRSLLYRNSITVLAGPPSAGKSRFCRSLIRYLVKGNSKKYMKERFWARCCAGTTMKILYWNFDCIPNLKSWREICLRGLNEKQKRDIFIEDAPFDEEFFNSFSGRPDVRAYRKKLAKYTFKGTPGHPLDLLIVDTLVSVWNKTNIEGSLRFLNLLMKSMPGMAVLAIHHTSELGKPLGGGDPRRLPRIVMTMERINRTVTFTPSKKTKETSSKDTDKKHPKKKTVTSLYKFMYDKISTSHADVEALPFYCVREDEDMYSVYKPSCTRDEMFSSIVYHYRNNDDEHPINEVIGAMLGYSYREVQKHMIDEKKYFAILNRAKKVPPITDEQPKQPEQQPKRGKRSKK